MRWGFAIGHKLYADDSAPRHYSVTITGRGPYGDLPTLTYPLDLNEMKEVAAPRLGTLDNVTKAIEKLAKGQSSRAGEAGVRCQPWTRSEARPTAGVGGSTVPVSPISGARMLVSYDDGLARPCPLRAGPQMPHGLNSRNSVTLEARRVGSDLAAPAERSTSRLSLSGPGEGGDVQL